jgi:hypothetical protein
MDGLEKEARAELARATQAYKAAAEARVKAGEAVVRLQEMRADIHARIDAAEKAVAEARESDLAAMAASVHGDTLARPTALKQARAALQDANDDLAAGDELTAKLQEDLDRAEYRANAARTAVNDAAARVVECVAPVVLERARAARKAYEEAFTILDTVKAALPFRSEVTPAADAFLFARQQPDVGEIATRWATAIAALKGGDANVKLPA